MQGKTSYFLPVEMERKSLTVKDLEPMIGKSNRVYEILDHKRSLTLNRPLLLEMV